MKKFISSAAALALMCSMLGSLPVSAADLGDKPDGSFVSQKFETFVPSSDGQANFVKISTISKKIGFFLLFA